MKVRRDTRRWRLDTARDAVSTPAALYLAARLNCRCSLAACPCHHRSAVEGSSPSQRREIPLTMHRCISLSLGGSGRRTRAEGKKCMKASEVSLLHILLLRQNRVNTATMAMFDRRATRRRWGAPFTGEHQKLRQQSPQLWKDAEEDELKKNRE